MKKKVSIVGLGWFGMDLAYALHPSIEVIGTKRKLPNENYPFKIFELDFERNSTLQSLSEAMNADCMVLNIPPNARAENATENYRFIIDSVEEAIENSQLKKLVFVSSTGVFGANEGEVDEFTTPRPNTIGGKILREAEERVLNLHNAEGLVLRPAGLVGEDRHPVKYLAGRKDLSGRFHPVNLVHRVDLIAMTEALILKTNFESRVFHACCSQNPPKQDFYRLEAEKRSLELPEFDQNDLSIGKKVSAAWSKKSLSLSFTFENPHEMPLVS
jgi:nucleoside-diphosphate-sugar epimerase